MPQIANLGIRLQWQFTIIDDAGNTHPLPSEPIQMQEPSEAAFLAAWKRWEAERDGHRANLAASMDAARQQQQPPNRAERRAAGRTAVKEKVAPAAPVDGRRADTAEQPVGVEE